MTTLRIGTFLFLLCTLRAALAVEEKHFFEQYNYHIINEKSGLPHCHVKDICQDSDGYVWIGTHYGISRYDGYRLLNFNSQTQQIRLKNDFVHKLCEDDHKRLWVATEGGIDWIDLRTYRQADFALPPDSALQQLVNGFVHTLYKDAQGNIWIAGSGGLWCIGMDAEGRVSDYRRLQLSHPPTSPIHAITDLEGGICAGIDNEICLIRKDSDKHLLTASPLSPRVLPFSEDWRISCMQTDGERLWIGSNRGLFRYNLRTGRLKRYRYSTHRPGMLSQAYITDIRLTERGHLIVATLNGVNVYHRDSDTFSFIRQEGYHNKTGINSNAIHCILTTGETIWLGTETGGVNLLSPKSLQTELWSGPAAGDGLSQTPVNTLAGDNAGGLWMGLAEKGLVHWNPVTQTCDRYLFSPDDIHSISNNTFTGILPDSDNRLWVYTWGVGINILDLNDPHNRRFYRYTREAHPSLKSDFINTACEDTLNRRIWFGSTRGLLYFDKATGRFGQLDFDEASNEADAIRQLLVDRKQRLWIGTTQGVFVVELPTVKDGKGNLRYTHLKYKLNRPESLQPEKINCLLEDREGRIWLGGNGSGLYLLTNDSTGCFTFANYTTEHGLSGNTLIGMTEDGKGNLWLMTHDGLTQLTPEDMTFTNYTQADGLPDTQYYDNGICYSHANHCIFLATTDGLLMIHPRDEYVPRSNPTVRLSTLTVAGGTTVCNPARIRLHERENRFTVGFTSCNYGNSNRIRFSYRLEGYEQEWNETSLGDHTARYTAVPPGRYLLQLRATNELGQWSNRITEVEVEIVPYFYKSALFYLPLLLLACCAAWWYYRRKLRRYREQRAELERKVEERTRELAVRNRQLEEMAGHVREVTEEKISFFTNITHEFRTPVTLINGPIELALKEVKSPKVHEQLEIAGRNARYLLSLVNELMDFRKLDTDRVMLDKKPCHVEGFVSELLLPFKVFANERNVKIRSYFRLNTPCLLWDACYMRKALVNLVANAVKFTPDGGRIDLFAASVHGKEGEPLLYIGVCDTGHGIVQEDLEKIFDRFYQSKHRAGYTGYGQSGTGIGLYLCRKIVELHDGQIYARNNRKRGATFRVLMPLVPAELPQADEPASSGTAALPAADPRSEAGEDKRRDTILVVEDNRDMQTYIGSLLEKDYRVLAVENGAEALDVVQRDTVDLIVSDLMMPVMDGMELSRRIKENLGTSHIPFLMLTAIRSDVQEKESLEIGVDEYLCKPFDAETLRLRIRNILELRNRYRRRFSTTGDIKDLHLKESSKDRKFIEQAIGLMKQHYANPNYALENFVRDMGCSKTVVNRKMQILTGQPIGQFMKGYRLDMAHKILQQNTGGMNVSDVAYAVGFNDPKYFTKCFKELFGYLPSTLLRK